MCRAIIFFLLILIPQLSAIAQSSLPRCQGDYSISPWHNCYGSLAYKNGDRFEGEFRDGEENGRGIYTHANGNRYEGEYRDGKRNGRGIYTFADGDRYEGEFRDGTQNGGGIHTFANGKRISGYWADGKYVVVAAPTTPPSNLNTASNRVRMKQSGGTFTVPVRLNDQITLDFTVDSGASVVTVPADVVRTLVRTNTLTSADFRGQQTYVLADGSEIKSRTVRHQPV